MSKIVFRFDEDRVDQEIQNLINRREEIAAKLEDFRLKLGALIRKEPLRKDLEEFLLLEDPKEAEVLAVKTWFRLDKIELPIDPYKAAEAMKLPDVVKELILAWERCRDVSHDPMKYWSDTKQSFKPITITKKEKEAIAERNRYYTGAEENIEMIDFLNNQLRCINHANEYLNAGLTMADISREARWLAVYIQSIPMSTSMGLSSFRFELKQDLLLSPGQAFEAFDEIEKGYVVLT